MTKFLSIIWEAVDLIQKVRTATALARMGQYQESKEAIL
jgi:hypothetical protein